jgi:hypothetical protein
MSKRASSPTAEKAKPTKVRVALELDVEFIRLLNAQVGLSGSSNAGHMQRARTPQEALAVAILFEARGAHEEQVYMAIPIEWRTHINVLHEERAALYD